MPIVNTSQPITSAASTGALRSLAAAYPFARLEAVGATVFQRPITAFTLGSGPRRLLFTAAHHANEWITALILLKFAEDFASALADRGQLGGYSAADLSAAATVTLIPMVDPDGVDLVTGAIPPGSATYENARRLAQSYPAIPFPSGWKANLLGVDLNLNYPAQWQTARQIKFAQGFTRPGPRDYVGLAPLDQLETQALYAYTRRLDPAVVLAFHSQGQEIYWQFGGYDIPGARELGQAMADASGYALADTPYASSFAGYKDWFIQDFRRPGYTVEVGRGVNPLPLSQFAQIYRACLPIMIQAITFPLPE
ncbi:MAG: M14 family metallocarboxypeptidase [Oscillospiraceae bacterium]|nr:M14 family metallocarboxypeptidase [Oscillospiraceae bacterium]